MTQKKRAAEVVPPAPVEPPASAETGFGIPTLETGGASGEIPQPSASAPESPETGPNDRQGDERAPRRGRGRPSGSKTRGGRPAPDPVLPPSQEEIDTLSRAMGLSFGVGFSILARARGKHWELRDDDKRELGDAWGPALAPYMGAVAKYAPIIGALLVTWEKFDARLQLDGMQQVVPAQTPGGVEVGRVAA